MSDAKGVASRAAPRIPAGGVVLDSTWLRHAFARPPCQTGAERRSLDRHPLESLIQEQSVTGRPGLEQNGEMPKARPLPEQGSIFLDARGGPHALRVSWHLDRGLVVLSLWHDNVCSGSFRLTVDDVPEMIASLRSGLDAAYVTALKRRDAAG